MALYSMYQQPSSQMAYEEAQRAQHQAIQSQLGYYSSEQHDIHQSQAVEYPDGTTSYTRPFATAYDPASYGYPIPLNNSYHSGIMTRDDLHHGFPYPRLMQPGHHIPGMSDEIDTASRPRLTAEQTRELESLYSANSKPSTQQKQEYASRFRLTKNRVDNWFQNRRAKSKQKHQSKTKHAEIILSDRTKLGSRSTTGDISDHREYSSYQYRDALRSQNATLDHLVSTNYANDHVEHLTPQDNFISHSWEPQQEEILRQNLVSLDEYSHMDDFPSRQVSERGSCASLSPISPKTFHSVSVSGLQHPQLAAEYPTEEFSPDGPVLTDLASHMDGIQLPTVQTPIREMFMIEPRRGFGERRPQRPAALHTMRSTSSGATLRSPLLTDGSMSRSIRRINTCGTPLNKLNRIHKFGSITPQRSPTVLSQAFERAMEQQHQHQAQLQQHTPHILSEAVTPESIDHFEDALEEREVAESEVIFNVDPPSAEAIWNVNEHGEFSVPPLSASLTGDDGSPPHTPLPGQESFINSWSGPQDMYRMASPSVLPFTAQPSPIYIQEQGQCLSSSSSHPSLPPYWDGPNNNSDMFLLPRSYEASDSLAQISRQDSPSSHYSSSYSGMSRQDNEALKIEFSHPHQETRSHYYVPLRENQHYIFHEYNPDNARRGD